MENNERILAKADVKYAPNKKAITVITIIYLIAVGLLLILGCISGSEYDEPEVNTGWFSVPFYESGIYYDSFLHYYTDYTRTYSGNIAWVFAMFIVLFATPFCINAIYKRQCKNTELYVSESYVYGSYSGFLSKKSLKMPIEKVDNLTNASTFKDKLRSGTTIGVCSASGIIRFHFVQNAEEVITAAMNRINELKTAPKAAPASSASTSDKLKELLSLKESGLITEEEFSAKKTELLTKM